MTEVCSKIAESTVANGLSENLENVSQNHKMTEHCEKMIEFHVVKWLSENLDNVWQNDWCCSKMGASNRKMVESGGVGARGVGQLSQGRVESVGWVMNSV
jgi:hypothetical protein